MYRRCRQRTCWVYDRGKRGGFRVRARAIAAVVASVMLGHIVVPSAMAAQAELAKGERPALPQQANEQASERASLAHTLKDVRAELRRAVRGERYGDKPLGTARAEARQALKALRKDLREQHRQAMAEFAEVGEMIETKALAPVIRERHEAALAKYRTEMDRLMSELATLPEEADAARFEDRASRVLKHLEKQKFGRSQQPFDPENLPNRSLKAKGRNAPKTSEEAFTAAGLFSNPYLRVAAVGDFDYSQLPGASDPRYLDATSEAVLSEAIQAKAAELDHDPVAIYDWVRDNVQWQPTWGAIQDAELTLSAQRGNAFDIASLTVALLRASGIPARYVHGTIDVPEDEFRNWIGGFEHINAALDYAADGGIPITGLTAGGRITKVRMEHIWVEAAIDFEPSRGAVNRSADTWVAMDPSFKQYEFLEGLDPVAVSGLDPDALAQDFLDSGTVNEEEGWVTGFDPAILQSAQDQTRQALVEHIEQNLPDATVGDVLGGRVILEEERRTLPATLANEVITRGAHYGDLPDELRQHITFGFGVDALGEPVISKRFRFSELNSERVTLSFRPATPEDQEALESLLPEGEITDISQLPESIPAYLIDVIPELKVGDEVVLEGNTMGLGEELPFTFTPEFAQRHAVPNRYDVVAGSYLAIASIAGNVSPAALETTRTRIEATRTALESGDDSQLGDLTRDDLLGDLFHAGLLGYYAQYTALAYVSGLRQGGHHQLAAGVGSYGYEPEVDTAFGIPQSIGGGGAAMNIPIVNVHGYDGDGTEGADSDRLAFVLQTGTLSSTLEHAVPEQMFVTDENPGEAISAVKALAKASAAGQRIYRVTQDNAADTLQNINHDQSTMDEIANAVAAGKEVITHTGAVSVPGWSGAGYVILDPETGDAAWKIGGGLNGSITPADSMLGGTAFGLMLAAIIGVSIAAGPFGLPLLFILMTQVVLPIYIFQMTVYDSDEKTQECWQAGVEIGAALLPVIAAAKLGANPAAITAMSEAILGFFSGGFDAVAACT